MDDLPPIACSCFALLHDHVPYSCERKGKTRGGICIECNYWQYNHESRSGVVEEPSATDE